VINMHTLKPLDEEAVVRAARETGIIVTAEEHQIGALAWRVSGVITASKELYGVPVLTGAIGVQDVGMFGMILAQRTNTIGTQKLGFIEHALEQTFQAMPPHER